MAERFPWILQDDPQFADLLQNVQLVISVFNREVDQAKGEGRAEWNVSQVLVLIKGKPWAKQRERMPQWSDSEVEGLDDCWVLILMRKQNCCCCREAGAVARQQQPASRARAAVLLRGGGFSRGLLCAICLDPDVFAHYHPLASAGRLPHACPGSGFQSTVSVKLRGICINKKAIHCAGHCSIITLLLGGRKRPHHGWAGQRPGAAGSGPEQKPGWLRSRVTGFHEEQQSCRTI